MKCENMRKSNTKYLCIRNDRDDLHLEEDETVGACKEYLYLGPNFETGPYREGNRRQNYKKKESDRMPKHHPMVKTQKNSIQLHI